MMRGTRARVAGTALAVVVLGACTTSAPPYTAPTPVTGRVVVDSFAAASFGGKMMRYHVLLPVGYDAARHYPVFWLLHGYGGNDANWLDLTKLVHDAAPYQMIVVMPAVGDTWYVDAVHDTTQRVEQYMVRELPAEIEKHFSVDTTRQAIAGLSMGGYGALMLALRHPNRYTIAGGLSAAISVPSTYDSVTKRVAEKSLVHAFGALVTQGGAADVFYLIHAVTKASDAGNLPNKRLSYFFVAIGESDDFPTFVPANRAFTDSLRVHRVAYEYHEVPGKHSWKVWGGELPPLLEAVWAHIGMPRP